MGVDILFFANHQVKGSSFKERIEDIEKRLQIEIQLIPNIPYSKKNLPKKTNELEKVIYFITNPEEEDNFNTFNEIKIETNFKYFSGMRVFQKTLLIYPNNLSTDFYTWKWLLGGKYEKNKKSKEYLDYNRAWKEFQRFKYQVVKKLGGNKIVYIDDHSFQGPEDLFYHGKELEEIIVELQKIGPLIKIEKLYNDFEKICNNFNLKNYGFYENLK